MAQHKKVIQKSGTKKMDWGKIPSKDKFLLIRKNVDDSISVMHLSADNKFFIISGYAAMVFEMIDGKRSFNKIKETILKEHDIPADRFSKDITLFVKKLSERKLIQLP